MLSEEKLNRLLKLFEVKIKNIFNKYGLSRTQLIGFRIFANVNESYIHITYKQSDNSQHLLKTQINIDFKNLKICNLILDDIVTTNIHNFPPEAIKSIYRDDIYPRFNEVDLSFLHN
jgi:hypothetical protein